MPTAACAHPHAHARTRPRTARGWPQARCASTRAQCARVEALRRRRQRRRVRQETPPSHRHPPCCVRAKAVPNETLRSARRRPATRQQLGCRPPRPARPLRGCTPPGRRPRPRDTRLRRRRGSPLPLRCARAPLGGGRRCWRLGASLHGHVPRARVGRQGRPKLCWTLWRRRRRHVVGMRHLQSSMRTLPQAAMVGGRRSTGVRRLGTGTWRKMCHEICCVTWPRSGMSLWSLPGPKTRHCRESSSMANLLLMNAGKRPYPRHDSSRIQIGM